MDLNFEFLFNTWLWLRMQTSQKLTPGLYPGTQVGCTEPFILHWKQPLPVHKCFIKQPSLDLKIMLYSVYKKKESMYSDVEPILHHKLRNFWKVYTSVTCSCNSHINCVQILCYLVWRFNTKAALNGCMVLGAKLTEVNT